MNDILGTKLLAAATGGQAASWFVNPSADWTVELVSVLVATKWAGEPLVAFLGTQFLRTSFASVRLRSVLDGRGGR